jgi:outer membrane lipoprotein SlyB
MLKNVLAIMVSLPLVLLAGCASNISSNSYSASDVGEATKTYEGTIVDKRIVEVKGNTAGQVAGAVGGAVGGGALGSLVGSGGGKTATTIGGAALGALAGNEAAKQLSKQEAYEYTVKLTNGNLRTVVQGLDTNLEVGQKVYLQISNGGRSRIMPNNSGV